MALSRLPLGLASTSSTLSLLFVLNNHGQTPTQPNEQKSLGLFETFDLWMTSRNEQMLRYQGYTPEKLYQSGHAAFANNNTIRARMQFAIMLRFTPQPAEAPVYEKSGDTLEERGFSQKAAAHWSHAFNYQHRPYVMNEKLGHYYLKSGGLQQAQTVFEHQVSTAPECSVAHNELGVTRFMRALKQNQFNEFENHKMAALGLFKKSSELKPTDRVSPLNHKVASLLTMRPVYGLAHTFLKTKPGAPTPMLDAVMQDLEAHRFETKSSIGSGVTIGTDSKGSLTLDPTIVSQSYQVPRYANEAALLELTKLKSEEYEQTHTVAKTP